MSGEDRRKEIIQILEKSEKPVSGLMLSKKMQVSRQVIVQDMALLRANGYSIYSTNRGYLVEKKKEVVRVLKVIHSDEDVEKELNTIVDMGGKSAECVCLSQSLWCGQGRYEYKIPYGYTRIFKRSSHRKIEPA